MSKIDIASYSIPADLGKGGGEMNCMKGASVPETNYGAKVVCEILNEIIDNAFDYAMLNSRPIKKPEVQKISPDLVGDIIGNILATGSKKDKKSDETSLLDDQIKKLINEMSHLSNDGKKIISTEGVGDQLITPKIESNSMSDSGASSKRNTLERKVRLTNLVRNSKQILNKFIGNESTNVVLDVEEEKKETVIKSVDLTTCDEEKDVKAKVSFVDSFEVDCKMEMNSLTQSDFEEAKECKKKEIKNKRKRFSFFKFFRFFKRSSKSDAKK